VSSGTCKHSVEVLSKSVTFLDFRLSQGSVAAYCRQGGNFCDVYIENFLTNHLVKKFLKSVHICQSYYQTSRDLLFLEHGVCLATLPSGRQSCCNLCNSTSSTLSSSVQSIDSNCHSRCCRELPQSFSSSAVRASNGWSLWWCDENALAWPAFGHCSRPLCYRSATVVPLSLSSKGKCIYITPHTQGAQVRITQFYLQITPYLLLPHKRLPDGASPDWDGGHLIAAYYSFVYPKGWKAELAWLADI